MPEQTISERLAERLQNGELSGFFDDDALRELCRTAIEKAFFEPRQTASGYDRKVVPPVLVEYAEDAFRDAIKAAIQPVVTSMVNDDAFNQMIFNAIQRAVQEEAAYIGRGIVRQSLVNYDANLTNKLNTHIGLKLGINLPFGPVPL